MMTDKLREAAQAALKLLDDDDRDCAFAAGILRAALAETQMPTKICGPNLVGILNAAGFYRKKEWVGLTDDEVNLIYAEPQTHVGQYAKAIETKLREKNT
jgi:hypothetical protein